MGVGAFVQLLVIPLLSSTVTSLGQGVCFWSAGWLVFGHNSTLRAQGGTEGPLVVGLGIHMFTNSQWPTQNVQYNSIMSTVIIFHTFLSFFLYH
jgi:hypothetical protein